LDRDLHLDRSSQEVEMRSTTLIALMVIVGWTPTFAVAGPSWQEVTKDDGIVVTQRNVPGRGFPTFRGVGDVNGSLYDVLAVLSDTPRFKQWMNRCAVAQRLRKVSETEYIIYMRTDAPWPVSDRDAVYHSKVHVDAKRKVVNIRFKAVVTRLKGPVDGVVRMTKLQGHYRLTALGASKTRVDYQVDADPAGSLPGWIARLATKRLPLKTLLALREQVKKTRGRYAARIARWKKMATRLVVAK
jgi:carbon monoxide dehydrogenase subunit G